MKGVFSSAAAFALAFALFLSGCAATGGGHSDDNDGSYFVQLGLAREDLYIDGENLSVGEYEQLMGELRTLLNGLEEKFSVEIGESDLSRVNGAMERPVPSSDNIGRFLPTFPIIGFQVC